MPSVQDLYRSSDTLSAADLPAGVEVPVVIESVRPVQFDDGAKLELTFRGKQKVLLANKTNANLIADQHGDDFETWPGKTIFLHATVTDFRGRQVPCVRVVRNPAAKPASQLQQQPVASQPPLNATTEELTGSDDIPF